MIGEVSPLFGLVCFHRRKNQNALQRTTCASSLCLLVRPVWWTRMEIQEEGPVFWISAYFCAV